MVCKGYADRMKHGRILMRLNRLNDMEQYIIEKETVSLEHLADHFQISMNTVRRDLNELLQRGRISKVYGGVSTSPQTAPLPMSVRSAKNNDAKQKIGRIAAGLVKDGDTIFLDSGSTVLCILPHLASRKNITVITHSLSVMYEAAKYPSIQLISLGGLYNHTTSSFVGISTLDALSTITPRAVYIAATGVSLERGLTNTTYFEAEIKRKVVQNCDRIILMADYSKFNYSSTISFYHFEDLSTIVTDRKPPGKYLEAARQNHISLLYEDVS